jgi:hypothetical protein
MTRNITLIAVCFLFAGSVADARSIAVNFMADSWGGGPFPLAPSETAGVFPQQWWNNADVIDNTTDIGGTADILSPRAGMFVDDQGVATSMTMTWYADKDAGSDGGTSSSDERLMKGFLEGYGGFSRTGYAVRVQVEDVPYERYKVVPYLIGFGFDATASARLNGEQYFYVQSSNFTTDGYIQATATSLANAQLATYAVFEGQTADDFRLDIITETGNRGALAGLQIISMPIPEPSSLVYALAAIVVIWAGRIARGPRTSAE